MSVSVLENEIVCYNGNNAIANAKRECKKEGAGAKPPLKKSEGARPPFSDACVVAERWYRNWPSDVRNEMNRKKNGWDRGTAVGEMK